ncbi:Lrp/AsnC family transcriptional regulator [Aliidongia sp.]|uniref:Lrp/AsnC family transcriptional regulator n=1 Tax=Aliidongia sp. TaxID=1914230 RepID=UPI0039C86E65
MTNQRLSEKIGLSPRPCLERVRRLETAGLISGYRAVIEIGQLPDLVHAFAEITLKSQATHALAAFERHLADCPEVVESFLVGGQFDYLAQMVCVDLDRYNELTTAWLDEPAVGVARINSRFVMKRVRRFAGYPVALLDRAAQQN